MRKKLVSLGFALAALVAASTHASATTPISCPAGTHQFNCPTYSFCCPNGAFCICRN